MKRIVFLILVALVSTFAMAQAETIRTNPDFWKSKYTKAINHISEISQKFANEELDKEQKDLLIKEYNKAEEELISIAKEVVKSGDDPEFIEQVVMQIGGMVDYEDLLVLMPKDAPYFNKPDFKGLRLHMEMLAKRAPGVIYTDLKMQDMNGKERSLSEWCAKGNYVLVDFWASWCRPCREEMPNVVEAYKRYHDKGFDVVGVSYDTDKEAWRKAVNDLGLSWHHISDFKGWDCAATLVYGIEGIPANILVDPTGKIVASDLRAEGLLEKLAEIYKD